MGYGFCATLDFFSTLPPDASRRYTALEKYPLPESQALPFPSLWEMFESDRDCLLRQKHWVHPPLRCELRIGDVRVLLPTLGAAVDVVFWDAFSPKVAPECWERPLFEQVFALINPGGCLLTYCSAGQVRRHLQAAGFEVIKVRQPGPKKETLQAWKI
jgi:tRNA U34 5-methylaminomethyl-2-thiouridine-forming methyltransferase MnmC